MRRTLAGGLTVVASLLSVGWTAFHVELDASYPEADAVLSEAPTEIWLQFSVIPDMERSSFSVQGPGGGVELGDISAGEELEMIKAEVKGKMPAGEYMVSWVGAPLEDHAVQGRFKFSLEAGR